MTQTSYLVGENNQNASYPNPPHDSGPYTSIQWRRRQRALLAGDRYSGVADPYATGPVIGYLNNLEVTVTAVPPDVININTGACFVDGNLLENGASVSITPGVPGAPPETWTVVAILNDQNSTYDGSADGLTIDFPSVLTDYNGVASVPTYSCRLGVLRAAPASLIQTDAVFMVPLYTFSIDGSQNITSLTKLWNWSQTPLAAIQLIGEQIADGANPFNFTSIPQHFRHLRIVIRAHQDAGSIDSLDMFFNGSAAAIYDWNQTLTQADGTTSHTGAVAQIGGRIGFITGSTGNSDSSAITIDIPDYARTNFRKSAIGVSQVYDNTVAAGTNLTNALLSMFWRNTAAINRVQVQSAGGTPNIVSGSIASLYGLM